MAKLALVAAPVFRALVPISVAGGAAVEVEFTFKHRTKTALDEFVKSRAKKQDAESVLAMAEGWELSDEFNAVNVELLLQNYIGAALAVYRVYIDQLVQARLGN